MLDQDHGFATASVPCSAPDVCSQLLTTADGGTTWQSTNLTLIAMRLNFTDAQHGWVAGDRCTDNGKDQAYRCELVVLATADGGHTWTQQLTMPTDATAALRGYGLVAAGPHVAWLLLSDASRCSMGGCWGPLWHTTDGEHWAEQQPDHGWTITTDPREGPPGSPADLHFVSPAVGWLAVTGGAGSGHGGIAITTDGGRTWRRDGGDWNLASIAPITASEAWVVGNGHVSSGSFLAYTTDGGHTWQQVLPVQRPVRAIAFVDSKTGFGVGSPMVPGALLETHDGGHSWQMASQIPEGLPVALEFENGRPTAFLDNQHGWRIQLDRSVTSHMVYGVENRADGDTTWTQVGTLDVVEIPTLSAPDHGAAFIAQGHSLVTTTDVCQTWSNYDLGALSARGLSFIDAQHGWLLARGGTLYATSDGGQSWQLVAPPTNP